MDNTTEINGNTNNKPRTGAAFRKAIEGELYEQRMKEFKGKLKTLVTDLAAANGVVSAKEEEIQALYEEYGVQPE